MLLEDLSHRIEQRVGDRANRRLAGVELNLLEDDDLLIRHANELGATVLGGVCVGLALLARASVLVVTNAVAVGVTGAAVGGLVIRLEAGNFDTGVIAVEHAVAVLVSRGRTAVLALVFAGDAGDVGTGIVVVEDGVAVAILGRRAAVLGLVFVARARNRGAGVVLVENAVLVGVSIGRATVLGRVVALDAGDLHAGVHVVVDRVAVGVSLGLFDHGGVGELEDAAEGRGTDAGGEAGAGSKPELEELHRRNAELRASEQLCVGGATVRRLDVYAASGFSAELQNAVFQQEHADTGAPVHLVTERHRGKGGAAAEGGPCHHRPNEAICATAEQQLRLTAH